MKKMIKLLCLAAILCVAYLLLTSPGGDVAHVMKTIGETNEDGSQTKESEAGDAADQVKVMGQEAVKQADEAIGDAVKRADEVLDNAVEQADKALADAVDSAAEGAKQGFVESLKESASAFWETLFP